MAATVFTTPSWTGGSWFRDVQTQLGAGSEIRSEIRSNYIDCMRRREALLAVAHYSGDHGNGNLIRIVDIVRDPLQWHEPTPGSTDEAIVGFVCARTEPKSLLGKRISVSALVAMRAPRGSLCAVGFASVRLLRVNRTVGT